MHSVRRCAESVVPQSSEHQDFYHCLDIPNQDRWSVKFAASLQGADAECPEIARHPGSRHTPNACKLAGAMPRHDFAPDHNQCPQTVSLTYKD